MTVPSGLEGLLTISNRVRSVIRGSIAFYEGQVDDARHTMMLSRTAAHFGAAVASSTRVVGFLADQTGPASAVL